MSWDFFDCVDQIRGDVEVAVLNNGDGIVGCLPFQRRSGRRAIPVAALLNDFHGPIGFDATYEELLQILHNGNLSRFDFHASPRGRWNIDCPSARSVAAFRAELGSLPGEFIEYLRANRYSVRQQERKTRALERSMGSLRLEWDTRDGTVFSTLLKWKIAKYRCLGIYNLFSRPWTSELLSRLLQLDASPMRGQLSALYAGNQLIAVHYGLRCGNLLHSWFPAYSAEHSRFSPGFELFLRLMTRGPAEGVHVFDFGYGGEPFKEKLSNQQYSLASGSVDLVPWRRMLLSWSNSARQQAKRLPWSKGMKKIMRRASAVVTSATHTS